MKKYFFVLALAALVLTGCKEEPDKRIPDDSGKFYYENKELGFSLVLPEEFLYYQTQRKEQDDFIDIEFFVPTTDKNYPQEVPDYAKPIVVRIFDREAYEQIEAPDASFRFVGFGDKEAYTIKFWYELPADWQEKWREGKNQEILESFEIM